MPQSEFTEFELSQSDRETLIRVAREAIASRLKNRNPAYGPVPPALRRKSGAFVTLHLLENGERCLRGCIGYIGTSFELVDAVKRAAVGSAFDDRRFPRLSLPELDSIRIEISVLSPFRQITDRATIRPGTDGVLIRRGARSGLLLPQVATEYGWDREALLRHTCMKAGLPADAFRDSDTEIEVFNAIVFGEEDFPVRGD
jgi:AmmeMemoRadiSam system protein A